MFLQGAQQAFHCTCHRAIALHPVGHIHKGGIDTLALGQRMAVAQKAVGLAHAAAHQHTLHGAAQALFRYGYEECHLRVGRTPGIAPGNYAQWIGKGRKLGSAGAKELFDGDDGAKLFFLSQAEFFHIQYCD